LDIFCIVYLDNILIYSKNKKDYIEYIKKVFKYLQNIYFFIDTNKYYFNITRIEFLGNIITTTRLEISFTKIQAVKDWPVPTSIKEIQSFLRFANYCKKFIKGFRTITRLFTDFTRKDKGISIDQRNTNNI
jgi:hypothetical protein